MTKGAYLHKLSGSLIYICASWLLLGSISFAEPFIQGRVVGITDGDTIVLLDDTNKQYKIRLAGIDAPEKGQPFGQASKEHLSQQAYKKIVNADCPKTDKYGRELCVIWVDGQDINIEQIHAGLAWHYKKYELEQTLQQREAYSNAEVEARTLKRGLWSDSNSIAPWDWRHRIKN